MKPQQYEAVRTILNGYLTLLEADKEMSTLVPRLGKALRWGMYDGFMGRPFSLSGLTTLTSQLNPEIVKEYEEGQRIGQEMITSKQAKAWK